MSRQGFPDIRPISRQGIPDIKPIPRQFFPTSARHRGPRAEGDWEGCLAGAAGDWEGAWAGGDLEESRGVGAGAEGASLE